MSSVEWPRNEEGLRIWILDGGPRRPQRPSTLPPHRVIGVDRGGRHALDLGLSVDLLIGDLDSIDDAARTLIEASGAAVITHPEDKDASDLELAIDLAASLAPDRIDVVSGGGGHLGHLLTGTLLIGHPDRAPLPLFVHVGATVITAMAPGTRHQLDTAVGDDVTLLAVGGSVEATTSGLRWNLRPQRPLEAATSRGLSNSALGDVVVVDMDPSSLGCLVALITPTTAIGQ